MSDSVPLPDDTAKIPCQSRGNQRGRSKVSQVLDLQASMYEIANDKAVTPRERAQAACAWERLQNRLDRMRGNPEPKPFDVAKEREAERRQRHDWYSGPVEPE
jgi:hypothetical protein